MSKKDLTLENSAPASWATTVKPIDFLHAIFILAS